MLLGFSNCRLSGGQAHVPCRAVPCRFVPCHDLLRRALLSNVHVPSLTSNSTAARLWTMPAGNMDVSSSRLVVGIEMVIAERIGLVPLPAAAWFSDVPSHSSQVARLAEKSLLAV